MSPRFDILGLGCTAVDELLFVDSFPSADGKARVQRRERHCGGLTATALIAAARLGGNCAFAGVLGRDEQSRFVLESLEQEKIGTTHAVRRLDARPIQSTVVVNERRKTRAIFFDINNVRGADPNAPTEQVIRSARVLLVDNFGIAGMIRAARIARAAGIPVVADFESSDLPGFSRLLALVDHLILSEDFACGLTGARHAAEATRALWTNRRQVVIVTRGAKGCYYLSADDRSPKSMPAFRIQAWNTTGCGDVFHGAYALALARNLEFKERIRFASAAAACKATRHAGRDGFPTWKMVNNLIEHSKL
jgi:sugar/nucleoside kinase (ribokinase family)